MPRPQHGLDRLLVIILDNPDEFVSPSSIPLLVRDLGHTTKDRISDDWVALVLAEQGVEHECLCAQRLEHGHGLDLVHGGPAETLALEHSRDVEGRDPVASSRPGFGQVEVESSGALVVWVEADVADRLELLSCRGDGLAVDGCAGVCEKDSGLVGKLCESSPAIIYPTVSLV